MQLVQDVSLRFSFLLIIYKDFPLSVSNVLLIYCTWPAASWFMYRVFLTFLNLLCCRQYLCSLASNICHWWFSRAQPSLAGSCFHYYRWRCQPCAVSLRWASELIFCEGPPPHLYCFSSSVSSATLPCCHSRPRCSGSRSTLKFESHRGAGHLRRPRDAYWEPSVWKSPW